MNQDVKIDEKDAGKLPNKVSAGISYKGMGKKDGTAIMSVLAKGDTTLRKVLEERAIKFEGNPDTIKDYLSGYGDVMGKTHKSEAKAVFEAMALDSGKLCEFKGIYSAWVKLAREIRNNKGVMTDPNALEVPVAKKVSKVTDKQSAGVLEKIPAMTKTQTEALLADGFKQLKSTSKLWEVSILQQIEKLCHTLKESEQPIYLGVAGDVVELVQVVMDEAKHNSKIEAEKLAEEKADEAKDDIIIPPAPHEVPEQEQQAA